MRLRGFTLLELIIAVVIIAILASLGIPVYGKMLEKSRVQEAVVVLHVMRTAEEEFRLENGAYSGWLLGTDAVNTTLNLDITSVLDGNGIALWTYAFVFGRNVAIRSASAQSLYAGENIWLRQIDGVWGGSHLLAPSN